MLTITLHIKFEKRLLEIYHESQESREPESKLVEWDNSFVSKCNRAVPEGVKDDDQSQSGDGWH